VWREKHDTFEYVFIVLKISHIKGAKK